jgi:hypothetical protein
MFSVLHHPASQAKIWGRGEAIYVYLCQHLGLCMSQARFTAKRRLLHVEAAEVRHIVNSKTVRGLSLLRLTCSVGVCSIPGKALHPPISIHPSGIGGQILNFILAQYALAYDPPFASLSSPSLGSLQKPERARALPLVKHSRKHHWDTALRVSGAARWP